MAAVCVPLVERDPDAARRPLARGSAAGGSLEIVGPGHGIWFESIIPDEAGTWYGYYHHEVPAFECGRPDRSIPRIGSANSTDRGVTWQDLGILLEAPPHSAACGSANRYVIGGVGDVSVILAPDGLDLFFYYSQYHACRRNRACWSRASRGPTATRPRAC